MLVLNKLDAFGKQKKRKVGRGGDRGGTSGKGHKGQRARTGSRSELKGWFEGGQMALTRRLPKRGFFNKFKKVVRQVNLRDLEAKFTAGEIVNKKNLKEKNIIKGRGLFFVKILGDGKLSKNLIVQANAFSVAAKDAIQRAGGKVELIKES